MSKRIIGIDYNGSEAKIVEISQSLKGSKIVSARSAVESEIKQNGGNNGQLAVLVSSFPQEAVINRLAHFPFSGSKKLEQATPFELESCVPFELDDYITDYQTVGKEKSGATVLIAGAKKEKIGELIGKWEGAGFNPHSSIPEGFAYRSLARAMKTDPKTNLVFLNIRESSTVLALTKGDHAIGARSLPFGLNDLTNGEKGGESVKRPFKSVNIPPETLDSVFGGMAAEITNTVRYFSAEEKIEVSRLILLGECVAIRGLPEWLSEKTGLDAEVWTTPSQFECDLEPEYAAALALALDHTHPAKGIDFRKNEFTHRSETMGMGTQFVAPAMLAAGILILWLINVMFQNRILQSQEATLDTKIAAIAAGVLGDPQIPANSALEKLNKELDSIKKMEEIIGKTDYLTPLQALTAVSSRIPASLDVDIEDFILNEETLSISGVITDYSQMDVITNALKGFDAFKRFDPPDLREKVGKKGGVQFTQKIFLTEEGEEKTEK